MSFAIRITTNCAFSVFIEKQSQNIYFHFFILALPWHRCHAYRYLLWFKFRVLRGILFVCLLLFLLFLEMFRFVLVCVYVRCAYFKSNQRFSFSSRRLRLYVFISVNVYVCIRQHLSSAPSSLDSAMLAIATFQYQLTLGGASSGPCWIENQNCISEIVPNCLIVTIDLPVRLVVLVMVSPIHLTIVATNWVGINRVSQQRWRASTSIQNYCHRQHVDHLVRIKELFCQKEISN